MCCRIFPGSVPFARARVEAQCRQARRTRPEEAQPWICRILPAARRWRSPSSCSCRAPCGVLLRSRMPNLSPPRAGARLASGRCIKCNRPGACARAWQLITSGRIRVNEIGATATFHDPCQIVRRGGLEAAARRVLAALGFELIEPQDHGLTGYCCRGGVVSNQRAAPLRHKVFELKKQQVEATAPRISSPVAANAASHSRWAPRTRTGTNQPKACWNWWPTT